MVFNPCNMIYRLIVVITDIWISSLCDQQLYVLWMTMLSCEHQSSLAATILGIKIGARCNKHPYDFWALIHSCFHQNSPARGVFDINISTSRDKQFQFFFVTSRYSCPPQSGSSILILCIEISAK